MTSSQDSPSLLTLDTFEESSSTSLAKGNAVGVTSVNIAISSTLSNSTATGKLPPKKVGGVTTISHNNSSVVSGKTNDKITSTGKPGSSVNSLKQIAGDRQQMTNSLQGATGASSKQAGLLPGPILAPPPSGRVMPASSLPSTSGSLPTVTATSKVPLNTGSQGLTSGAVRRLFTAHQQHASTSQNSAVFSSLLGPQPANYSPLVNNSPAPSLPINPVPTKGSSSQTSKVGQQSIYQGKSLGSTGGTRQGVSGHRVRVGDSSIVTQTQPSNVSSSKDKHPMTAKNSQSMYSSVITTGAVSLDSQNPLVSGNNVEVIEQPLQQIMKTPVLFQDPATHLTKPRKKSTYSDAVGKKNDLNQVPPSQGVKVVSQLGGMGSSHAPTVSTGPQHSPLSQQQHQHKLNLASGTRPMSVTSTGEKVKYHIYLLK